MSTALITFGSVSTLALTAVIVMGFLAGDRASISAHVGLGVYSTLMLLLSHSLTMFYLIGKGKAIREAIVEGNLAADLVRQMSAGRRPVFGAAPLALAFTMAAAILGGGVDTRTLPTWIHSSLAIAALLTNLRALRIEIRALNGSDRLAREVNRQLGVGS